MGDIDPTVGEHPSPATQGARRTGMVRPALAIELDYAYAPFRPGYGAVPFCFSEPFARAYMHETLHFWQTLSQGFITNLAVSEWRAAKTFRESGALSSDAEIATAFTATPQGAPFSPWQLSESLCRFWDVHIYGPQRLLNERRNPASVQKLDSAFRPYTADEFDAAMTGDDAYAEPYRWALKHWGSVASVLLFPLVGHFALQTRKPVQVFMEAGSQLLPLVSKLKGSIHENWRQIFVDVQKAVSKASFVKTGAILTPGWDVMERTPELAGTLWNHYLELLKAATRNLKVDDQWTHDRGLAFAFALPGDPLARNLLVTAFQPSVTVFNDGRWVHASTLSKMIRIRETLGGAGSSTLKTPVAIAQEAEAIRTAYWEMRQRAVLRRYESSHLPEVPR